MTQAAAAPLQVANLSKSFKSGGRLVKALDDVSFQVRPGIVAGLVGPDAAGKTTLMRLAAGLIKPDSGSIEVLGKNAAASSLEVQGMIGYMPQRFGLYQDLTVAENLALYADLQGVPESDRPQRFGELMHMAGLAPFQKRLAGNLSGGMKQKLGLACVLVRQPPLLLLDEPTVGVDPVSRRELWSIIERLVSEMGASVLLSTAYLDEAERCDEVVLLHNGLLLAQGAPEEFNRDMQGRTFSVAAPPGFKRSLQRRLARAPGVVDALVQGNSIRLVMESPAPPDAATLAPDLAAIPVAPRFEDSFIATLRKTTATHPVGASATRALPGGERLIEIDRLERRFGDFAAVKGISFSVGRGEVFGLLGANGAGKSTTFRMLCGLLPASSGKLRVAGLDLRHSAPAARAKIGYMSQKFSLYANLTVLENLRFFAAAYGLSKKRGDDRIDWALDEFALAPLADAVSSELSLGFQQRLALACSLMHEPEILFLDEPTSGVDPLARREFWTRINSLAESGVTIMVTTHFMEEAEYCDRLAIMAQGEILSMGTPDEIKARAASVRLPAPSMEDAFVALIEKREVAA